MHVKHSDFLYLPHLEIGVLHDTLLDEVARGLPGNFSEAAKAAILECTDPQDAQQQSLLLFKLLAAFTEQSL